LIIEKELTVDVTDLKGVWFLLKTLFLSFCHLPEVLLIKRAAIIPAFVDQIVLTLLDFIKRLMAVGASKNHLFGVTISLVEMTGTHLAGILSSTTVVVIKVIRGSPTPRAGKRFWYMAWLTPFNGFERLTMGSHILIDELLVIKFFKFFNDRHVIDLEFPIRLVNRFIVHITCEGLPHIQSHQIDNDFMLVVDICQ
jgi:hypothetical protein